MEASHNDTDNTVFSNAIIYITPEFSKQDIKDIKNSEGFAKQKQKKKLSGRDVSGKEKLLRKIREWTTHTTSTSFRRQHHKSSA